MHIYSASASYNWCNPHIWSLAQWPGCCDRRWPDWDATLSRIGTKRKVGSRSEMRIFDNYFIIGPPFLEWISPDWAAALSPGHRDQSPLRASPTAEVLSKSIIAEKYARLSPTPLPYYLIFIDSVITDLYHTLSVPWPCPFHPLHSPPSVTSLIFNFILPFSLSSRS